MRNRFLLVILFLIPGLAVTAGPDTIPRPQPRPDWIGSDLERLIALSDTLLAQFEDSAGSAGVDQAPPDRQSSLLDHIGFDLSRLDEQAQLGELQSFARIAVSRGRPEVFQSLMAAHIDPSWGDLPPDLLALNIMAWLPDTATFLDTRIALARHLARIGSLTFEEQEYLWKDLRVRVERVGHPGYIGELLAGMAESRHASLLLDTLERFFLIQEDQFQHLQSVLLREDLEADRDVVAYLVGQLDILWALGQSTRNDPRALARLHHALGHEGRSNDLLQIEQDPALRLRSRLSIFLDDDRETSEAGNPEKSLEQKSRPGATTPVQVPVPGSGG